MTFHTDFVYDENLETVSSFSYGSFTTSEDCYFESENDDDYQKLTGETFIVHFVANSCESEGTYKILDQDEMIDKHSSTISVDGTTYRALWLSNSVVFGQDEKEKMLNSMLDKGLFNIDKLVKLNEAHKDYLQYEKDLVNSGGNGYVGIFDEEIRELFTKVDKASFETLDEINNSLRGAFFSYGKSLINDLSVDGSGLRTVFFDQPKHKTNVFTFKISDVRIWMRDNKNNSIQELIQLASKSLYCSDKFNRSIKSI